MIYGGIELNNVFNEHKTGFRRKDYLQEGYEYFNRKGIGYILPEDFCNNESTFSLVIKYIDDEISYASACYHRIGEISGKRIGDNPAFTTASACAGYTLVGTGRIRHVVFILSNPAFGRGCHGADVMVFGIRNILSAKLVKGVCEEAIETARAERPSPEECKPLINLNRPLQLVSTAGIDSHVNDDIAASLKHSLENMREICPLIRVLGFNGVESYVKWNFIEYEKGTFDYRYYDAIIEFAAQYGLGWFPLLIGGSGYALPEWYHDSEGFTGFACLEHGESNDIPTIFNDHQIDPVSNYLYKFGRHYNGNENVLGVRLGPSGNYGESQYPATGNWGYKGTWQHMHIGWWAGDKDASTKFREFLKKRYNNDITKLNALWKEEYNSFDELETFLPSSAFVPRKRKDFTDWYVFEMTDWCEKWAIWTREYLKTCDIYQSAGGWGFIESGTDFTDQTRSMIKVNGGIRATNEDESYVLNFCITRMLSSAARFYGVDFGTEPAAFCSARGFIGRLYNIIVNNGAHFFTYHPNFVFNDQGINKWLKYASLLERRAHPVIEVAVLYPDTMTKLEDATLRHLDGSAWFSQVITLRSQLDFDYCSEQMILDGALEGYKVLVFLSRFQDGELIENKPLVEIDQWIRSGGTAIYCSVHHKGVCSVEGDYTIFNRWMAGDTGKGRVIVLGVDREPVSRSTTAIKQALLQLDILGANTRKMLTMEKSEHVYASVLESGDFALLNFSYTPERVSIEGAPPINMEPVSIELINPNE
ncbi:MAG TPA: hypothetical protein PK733_12865 [Clostridiales bacterium]|nr:hypothetical protein [Clostridiales bacterium]